MLYFANPSPHSPGVGELDLDSLVGDKPIRLVAYELKDSKGPHTQLNKEYLFCFECPKPESTAED